MWIVKVVNKLVVKFIFQCDCNCNIYIEVMKAEFYVAVAFDNITYIMKKRDFTMTLQCC